MRIAPRHMAAAVAQAEIAHPSPFGIKPPLTTPTPPPLSSIKHHTYGEAFALMGGVATLFHHSYPITPPRHSTTKVSTPVSDARTPLPNSSDVDNAVDAAVKLEQQWLAATTSVQSRS